jgi:hypothetical protein
VSGDPPILPALEALPRARPHPDRHWTACCPAHDDGTPSLDWRLGRDRRVLLICHAGCETEVVVEVLGYEMSDLFPPDDNDRPVTRTRVRPVITDYEIRDADG